MTGWLAWVAAGVLVAACGDDSSEGGGSGGTAGDTITGGMTAGGATGGGTGGTPGAGGTGTGGIPGIGGTPGTPAEDHEAVCAERDHAGCYYVSSSGNYPAGTEGHHLTLAEVSTSDFDPGDVVLFARGDTWRAETNDPLIELGSSGTAESYLQFGAYGTGDNPRFLGSIRATDWTNVSGNVWQSATSVPIDPWELDYHAQVFVEHANGLATFGHHEDSASGLDREGDWTWGAGQISVYSTGDPATAFASVEVPQSQRLILLNDQEYVAFDSFTLRYMVNAGFSDRYANGAELQGLEVTNSEVAYIGVKNSGSGYGFSLDRSGIRIAGSSIHDCGRRGISLVLYQHAPSVIRDVVIENNHFFNGYHTTAVDVQSNTPTSGSHVIENLVIRNNRIDGDPSYDIEAEDNSPSNHVFMNRDDGSVLRDVYVYGNVFTYMPGSGIKLSGERVHIHHNTFYGFNPTYDNYQAQVFCGSNSFDVTIENNIFVNDTTDGRYAAIELATGRESEYSIDYNLYHSTELAHSRLLWVDGGTSHYLDDWSGYQSATGFDANSPTPAAPRFVDAPADVQPRSTSPAAGAAKVVSWVTTDFLGQDMHDPPDLGAIQVLE